MRGIAACCTVAMLLLPATAPRAEEPATGTPALWGSPTVDNGACCRIIA